MIHTKEPFVEERARLLAVVQRYNPESDTWRHEGQVGGLRDETFEKGARAYLSLYRKASPQIPKEHSRVVRRTVTVFDEPMEW